jgi:hypothetical protein
MVLRNSCNGFYNNIMSSEIECIKMHMSKSSRHRINVGVKKAEMDHEIDDDVGNDNLRVEGEKNLLQWNEDKIISFAFNNSKN